MSYRFPIDILNLGVTQYWDFRDGYSGNNSGKVQDMVDGIMANYRGTTALSSVYTANEYSADLERAASDYFMANDKALTNNVTSETWFAWVKRESAGIANEIFTQWETTGNQRGFMFRFLVTDVMELALSSNGTVQALYDTTETLTDTTAWHFIVATYDTTNRGQFYVDKTIQTTTLTSGVAPASINSSPVGVMIGARQPSVPAGFFDGKVGICGIAQSKSMTQAEINTLYEITNVYGKYV